MRPASGGGSSWARADAAAIIAAAHTAASTNRLEELRANIQRFLSFSTSPVSSAKATKQVARNTSVNRPYFHANQSCGYKLLRILTPVPRESSTKMLESGWDRAEPWTERYRITESEGESDESKGDLYCIGNCLGYQNCGMPGPRIQRCQRAGEERSGRHTLWRSPCQYQPDIRGRSGT